MISSKYPIQLSLLPSHTQHHTKYIDRTQFRLRKNLHKDSAGQPYSEGQCFERCERLRADRQQKA